MNNNSESQRQFMSEWMPPESIDVNNWEAFTAQIRRTFPENDHIRVSIASINRGEEFISISE